MDQFSVPDGIVRLAGSDAAAMAPPGSRSVYQPSRFVMWSNGLSSQLQSVSPQYAHGRLVVMSLSYGVMSSRGHGSMSSNCGRAWPAESAAPSGVVGLLLIGFGPFIGAGVGVTPADEAVRVRATQWRLAGVGGRAEVLGGVRPDRRSA